MQNEIKEIKGVCAGFENLPYVCRPLSETDWESYRDFRVQLTISNNFRPEVVEANMARAPSYWRSQLSIPSAPLLGIFAANAIVGFAAISGVDVDHPEYRVAELVAEISPPHQGKGLGKRLYPAMVHHAAMHTEYDALTARITDTNVPSIKSSLKAGFIKANEVMDPEDPHHLYYVDLNLLRKTRSPG